MCSHGSGTSEHAEHRQPRPKRDDFVAHLSAGTAAGVAQLLIGHPFDTVKVKMQSSTSTASAMAITTQVVSREGVRGIYRGMGPPLVAVAAFNAILFSARGAAHKRLARPDGLPPTATDNLLATSFAGVTASFLACPTELLKCRLQHQGTYATALAAHTRWAAGGRAGLEPTLFRGPLDVARSIWAHERGLRGMYTGLRATLAREIPGNVAMFGVYEWMKTRLAASQGLESSAELGSGALLLAGGLGGTAFWLAAYPADVIKSRLQTQRMEAPEYRGMLDCACKMYASVGLAGFARGLTPCLLRSFPANAAAFVAYESYLDAISTR